MSLIIQQKTTKLVVKQNEGCNYTLVLQTKAPVNVAGAENFTDLLDVPQDYADSANKAAIVKEDELGLEFKSVLFPALEKLTFDGLTVLVDTPHTTYNTYKLTAAVNITIVPAELTKGAVIFLKGNGNALHVPTFLKAEQDGDDSFITTDNYVNPVIIWYRGDKFIYRIMAGYVSDTDPMLLTSTSFSSISQIAATFNYTADKSGSIVWGVYSAPESQPTKAEILAGTNATDYGTKTVSSAGIGTIGIDTLTYFTEYTIFYYTISENSIESDILFANFQTIDLAQLSAAVMTITSLSQTSLGIAIDSNPNGVDVYMSEASGGVYSLYQSLASGVLAANNLTGLSPNSIRYFKNIKKGDGVTTSDSALSSEYSGTTSGLTQLIAPTIGAVTVNSDVAITVEVSAIDQNATYVQAEHKESSSGTWTIDSSTLPINTTSYQFTGLTSGRAYDFRYKVLGGGIYSNSEYSSIVTATALVVTAEEDVIFKSLIGQTQVGATISKPTGTAGYNSEGIGAKSFFGDGYYKFTMPNKTTIGSVGLAAINATRNYIELTHCMAFNTTQIAFFQLGVELTGRIAYNANDIFKINISGTTVTVLQNDILVKTYTTAFTAPLFPDVCISSVGGSITNNKIQGLIAINNVD